MVRGGRVVAIGTTVVLLMFPTGLVSCHTPAVPTAGVPESVPELSKLSPLGAATPGA